ncbi:dTDP-4-dehydrorhamnose 3,5-epimerase [soil metagenome]
MIFTLTEVPAAVAVDVEKHADPRGFFARVWSSEEFAGQGLSTDFVQANMAFNHRKGTLRGMHYQIAPHQEAKLVRCTRGAIFDAVLDLRPDSPTYRQWAGLELSSDNHRMLYIPEGCAHGYQTLADDTEVFYLVSASYSPQAERGIRYDDPSFGIDWPLDVSTISEKDRAWPLYSG